MTAVKINIIFKMAAMTVTLEEWKGLTPDQN